MGYQLTTTFGLTVTFDYSTPSYPSVNIKLPFIEPLKGNVFGYCGNMDGNAMNDNFCWNPSLQTFQNYEECWPASYLDKHVSSWGNGYFSCPYTQDILKQMKQMEIVEKPSNLGFDQTQNSIAQSICNVLIDPNGVFGSCQQIPNIDSIYSGCTADLSVTNGDRTLLCQYAKQLAVECINSLNIQSLIWRSANFCRKLALVFQGLGLYMFLNEFLRVFTLTS